MQARLRSGRPPALIFWYRSSPRPLIPAAGNDRVSLNDPPLDVTNMRTVLLDSSGRLVEFAAVPPQLDEPPPAAPATTGWPGILQLADLDITKLKPATPLWTPRTYADERVAWEGPMPGWPEQQVRVEAAAYRGRLVSLQMVSPWTQPERMREAPRTRTRADRPAVHCPRGADRARHRGAGGAPQPAQGPRGPARSAADLGGHLRGDFRRLAAERETRDRRRRRARAPLRRARMVALLRRRGVAALPGARAVCQEVLADDADLLEPLRCRQCPRSTGRPRCADRRGRCGDHPARRTPGGARSPDARLSDGPDRRAEPRHAARYPR